MASRPTTAVRLVATLIQGIATAAAAEGELTQFFKRMDVGQASWDASIIGESNE